MAEVTCIIVDDELQNQEVLARMINQFCPSVDVLGRAENVANAVKLIESVKPDIVFLDIEMPGGNGFTLFDRFPSPGFFTVFTTAHAEYAIKAIKFAAFDYLLKPINLTELKNAVERVAEKIRDKSPSRSNNQKMVEVLRANSRDQHFEFKKIALSSSEGLDFYKVEEILRCEADRAYCTFHLTGNRKIIVSKSLKEYEDILAEVNFFRVHKSNMVNMSHVKKYIRGKGGFVVLTDNSMVAVAIRKKDELMEILHKQKSTIEVQAETETQ